MCGVEDSGSLCRSAFCSFEAFSTNKLQGKLKGCVSRPEHVPTQFRSSERLQRIVKLPTTCFFPSKRTIMISGNTIVSAQFLSFKCCKQTCTVLQLEAEIQKVPAAKSNRSQEANS